MRVLLGFLLSIVIDIALTLLAIGVFSDKYRWSIAFFVLMMWPIIWMLVIFAGIKNPQAPNMMEMQNYWNTAAIRRNTDRLSKEIKWQR